MIDLTILLQSGESETLEFKERWNDGALEVLAAFANTRGGTLLVGVDDKGQQVRGWQGDDKALQRITSQITALRIHPSITEQKHGGHRILVVQVEKAPMYVACHGRYYRRVGNTTLDIPPEELGRLLRDQVNWDRLTGDYPISEIDEDSVRQFIRMAKDRLPHAQENESTESILEKLELLQGGKLTRGAVLLFGKNPQRYFPLAEVHMGRFKDATTITDDKLLKGNLFQQQNQAAQLFQQYLQVRYEMPSSAEGQEPQQSFRRREIWDYPLDALREAVVNALVHRDYFNTSMDIMIRVYDDQVVITNPGSLPQGVTVEELKRAGHPSIQRNPLLAQVFYYAQLVEKWGTGTSRMIELCSEHGLPAPEFEDTPSWFQVTFAKDPYTKERLLRMGLAERQIKAVLWTKEKGEISNNEYQELCNVSKRTATRDLSDLLQRGILEQAGRGTGKSTIYLLQATPPVP